MIEVSEQVVQFNSTFWIISVFIFNTITYHVIIFDRDEFESNPCRHAELLGIRMVYVQRITPQKAPVHEISAFECSNLHFELTFAQVGICTCCRFRSIIRNLSGFNLDRELIEKKLFYKIVLKSTLFLMIFSAKVFLFALAQ